MTTFYWYILLYLSGVVLCFYTLRLITSDDKKERSWENVFTNLFWSLFSYVLLSIMIVVFLIMNIIEKFPNKPPRWL